MNIKILIYILICLTAISCKTETKKTDLVDYSIFSKTTIESENTYDEKGLLKYVISKHTTKYAAYVNQETVFSSKKDYYYDQRDSLIKTISYSLPKKKIEQIEYLSDSSFEAVLYREYPNDTSFWDIAYKNNNGYFFATYREYRDELPDGKIEIKRIKLKDEYNEENVLTKSLEFDLTQNKKNIITYQYHLSNDTTYTNTYKNGVLVKTTQKYNAKDLVVEVSESLSPYYIDSTFYIGKNVIKSVSYTPDGRDIFKLKYDEKGNEIKSTYEVWEIKK